MERLGSTQKWVCAVVLTLGISSSVLGFLAEVYRIKQSDQIHISNNRCVYPSSPALVLGVVAALVLLVAQIIVNVFGGCICCTPGPPLPPNTAAASNRSIAVICLVACWITFLNAFALLMAGASLNNQRQQYFDGSCTSVKPLVFAGGALLALATVVLGLIFYLASCAAKAAMPAAHTPTGVALGHPYPAYYGPPAGNAQAYSYSQPPPSFPSQNLMPIPTNPTAPVMGYPDVVTGYPKPVRPDGVP